MNDDDLQRDLKRDRYHEWLDDIFELVRAKLGGDAGQGGSDRWYGRARFGYDMRSDEGDVIFAITRTLEGGMHRRRDLEPIEWRAHAPTRAAEILLATYDELEATGP